MPDETTLRHDAPQEGDDQSIEVTETPADLVGGRGEE